jgi:hypothetical protein
MALYELSGPMEIGRRKKAERKKKKEERKTKRAEKKASGKGFGKKIAKIGLVPARASFLLAVNLNLLKVATKLYRLHLKQPEKLKAFWEKFGGDLGKLKQAINKGAKVSISGPSVLGQGATAIIGTALPIIIALMPLLKSLGLDGDTQEQKELEAGIDAGKKELEVLDKEGNPNVEIEDEDVDGGGIMDMLKKYWYVPVGLGVAGLIYYTSKPKRK